MSACANRAWIGVVVSLAIAGCGSAVEPDPPPRGPFAEALAEISAGGTPGFLGVGCNLELVAIGDYAVVPDPLLDADVNGLGAFDAFGSEVVVLRRRSPHSATAASRRCVPS